MNENWLEEHLSAIEESEKEKVNSIIDIFRKMSDRIEQSRNTYVESESNDLIFAYE